jgi:hypothetical protein
MTDPLPGWRCVPRHRALVAVDIANSTIRANPAKAQLRRLMYGLLEESLRVSGISARHHDPLINLGDGALIPVHPSDQLPRTMLLDTLIPTLRRRLAQHNARHRDQAFQLRAAVHAGEIHRDQWGMYGEALDLTCRLLDAVALKQVLANTMAPLALVVSDDIYRSIIRHRYDDIDDQEFHPIVRVELGGVTYPGWVQTPAADRAVRWPQRIAV